ncbi:hypothetical protein [Massilia scottii]|uniref:hypothetical protein n=1 Tax=Massilia scottii TaxID=3057166 RepID=UPI0027964E9B|nr:hypothetical protein [Massilia sp. CCM 9029]MDQ1834526.1 hypothetical protein [Massilia sp. CCM 9029]
MSDEPVRGTTTTCHTHGRDEGAPPMSQNQRRAQHSVVRRDKNSDMSEATTVIGCAV